MRLNSSQDHPSKQKGTRNKTHQPLFRGASYLACFVAALIFTSTALHGQEGPTRDPDRPYIIPEANPLPDANDRMVMNEKKVKQQNFDAANALRTKQIVDDTTKLLILSKDLKAKTDKLGNEPLPKILVREAEVIELLAHDVQRKMKLTVGGD
jgi:hypothetical protein